MLMVLTRARARTIKVRQFFPLASFTLLIKNSIAGLGACGFTNKDTDRVIAVTEDFFDHFPCVFRRLYVFLLALN